MADNELFVPLAKITRSLRTSISQATLYDPAAPVNSTKVNLDADGNPLLDRFTTERDRKLAALPLVISVDWRSETVLLPEWVEEEEEETVAPGDVEFPAVEAPAGKYANEWYSSPLDDKRFGKRKTDWDLVREALRVLPETAARAEADYHSLYAYARDNGELPEQLEDEEEEEEDNPFYGKY
ncbi:hypothetical protein PoHVEF18_010701 [Penicillium ochrochloron]